MSRAYDSASGCSEVGLRLVSRSIILADIDALQVCLKDFRFLYFKMGISGVLQVLRYCVCSLI